MEKTIDPVHEIGEIVTITERSQFAIDNARTGKKNEVSQNRKSGD